MSDRRLMNTSPDLVPVMKEALISDFNMLLYRTGHSFKYRVDVIKRALKKYEEKVQKRILIVNPFIGIKRKWSEREL